MKDKKIKSKVNTKVRGPSLKELEIEIKKDITNKHSKKGLFFWIPVLLISILLFIGLHLITPNIELNGESELKLTYHEEYKEQGAKASLLGKDFTDEIKISGKVESGKVGTYEIEYQIKNGIYHSKKKRNISVVDEIDPIIELTGEEELNICPTSEYEELGFTAKDEYDGNLTDKVEVEVKDNEVIYKVKDSSGNIKTVTRKINRVDKDSPEITLKGTATVHLTPTEEYSEPGYTAVDNCEGDLTDKVKVSGKVENGKIGTYLITYEVEDSKENITKVERKVVVAERTDPDSGEIKKGAIYLTFDDGPSAKTTKTILDILKEEGVKATFFVTNNGPDALIKRMYDEGHTVGLHTASHKYEEIYSSLDAYFKDLKKVSDRVKRITGQTSKIIRFPGGSSNRVSIKYCKGIMTEIVESIFDQGYRYYDWNIDSSDSTKAKTSSAVYENVTKALSKDKANVVLMHDIKTWTKDAIKDIIKYGKENGYTFEKIDMDTHMVRQRIKN